MREGVLLGRLLNNAERWINISQKNIEDLEKTNLNSQRKVSNVTENPSRVFMMLELGNIPVIFVIMKKCLQFLHYILNEKKSP